MKLEYINRATLQLAPYNPRIMAEEELVALRQSIATFGWAEPIVVNEHYCEKCGSRKGVVVGGHQRLKATEGTPEWEQVPAVFVYLHTAQEMQLNIALNKTGGQFDTIKLKHLMRELEREAQPLLALTGFSADQIANILEPVEMPELDAFAKVPDRDLPDYTTMSFTVSKRQAAEIIKAMNTTREIYKTPKGEDEEQTIGAALVAAAKHYLQNHGNKTA